MMDLRHKRSKANININHNISFPVPSSATTLVFDENGTPQPLQQQQQRSNSPSMESRFSGEHLTPRDGYSTLFTSGLKPIMLLPSPTLSSFPSLPRTSPRKLAPSHISSGHHLSAGNASPVRRRRSSIIHTTPSSTSPKKLKSVGSDGGVERALDNVMRSLKLVAMGTPRGRYDYDYDHGDRALQESRWSTSTDNTTRPSLDITQDNDSFFSIKPRKSSETQRSRAPSRATIRSTKSKGRKSEDTDRMAMDIDINVDNIPNLPPKPVDLKTQYQIPATPGRSKRLVQGLVRRLRLTPKKSRGSPQPSSKIITQHTPKCPNEKGSTTTLRSVRSIHQIPHPFAISDDTPLPLPGLPQPPHTPRSGSATGTGRRTPKSSIGQPKLQPETSPSFFLDKMPRRAPETPKRTSTSFEHQQNTPTLAAEVDTGGVIKFETEEFSPPSRSVEVEAELEVGDMTMGEEDDSMDQTREEIFTPSTSNKPMVAVGVAVAGLDSPFAPVSQSTPTPNPVLTGTSILTAKAAAARANNSAPKPRRSISLLPKHQQKLDSPSPSLYRPMPLGLRSENLGKSSGFNSLGLPIPTKNRSSLKQGSRRDPLGIIRRLGDRDRERERSENVPDMPFLSGAGDGWGTPAIPLPSQSRVSLGTKESYFDYRMKTDTFGRKTGPSPSPSPSCDFTKARPAIPDFTAAAAAPSSSASTTSSIPIDEREGSPEYSFHLELDPNNNDRFTDEPSHSHNEISISSNTSIHGLDWDKVRARGMERMSQGSIDSVSMTTGEGVEEWELERYLKDLENEDFRGSERVAA